MTPWLIAILAVGILLLWVGRNIRSHRGLGQGRTTELDDRNLYSARHGLIGRPDRVVDGLIPEEWKSSKRLYDSHRAQIGVYFILIEEETGRRPPHGFVVTGDGQRHRIDNTPELRAWVLDIANHIRAARRQIDEAIPVTQPVTKCRTCGLRPHCRQASQ